jgi:tetraacyldisaccharide 4'-kinase
MSLLEQSWYQKGHWLSVLLLPLAALYWLIISIRLRLFLLGVVRCYQLTKPVVIVGNISVGGTGKTPFTLWLCQQLQAKGIKPGIISRGYGANITKPLLVVPNSLASAVGDEPLLLARRSNCPVVVCPDRVAAGRALLALAEVDIILCDDGLQHYRLLLPAGPLREPRTRLAKVDLIIANSGAVTGADCLMQLQSSAARALLTGRELAPCSVTLVAGIGHPQRFALTAVQAGFTVVENRFFSDHHQFSAADFSGINGPVLMTEKDAVKCQHFANDDWYFLPVDARFSEKDTADILHRITTLLE